MKLYWNRFELKIKAMPGCRREDRQSYIENLCGGIIDVHIAF